jgi:hypothetical protein
MVAWIEYHPAHMVRTRDRLSVPTLLRAVSDVGRFVVAMCRPRATRNPRFSASIRNFETHRFHREYHVGAGG